MKIYTLIKYGSFCLPPIRKRWLKTPITYPWQRAAVHRNIQVYSFDMMSLSHQRFLIYLFIVSKLNCSDALLW